MHACNEPFQICQNDGLHLGGSHSHWRFCERIGVQKSMTKGEQIMRLTVQKMNGQPISNRKYQRLAPLLTSGFSSIDIHNSPLVFIRQTPGPGWQITVFLPLNITACGWRYDDALPFLTHYWLDRGNVNRAKNEIGGHSSIELSVSFLRAVHDNILNNNKGE